MSDRPVPETGEREERVVVLTHEDAKLLKRFLWTGGAPDGTAWDDLWKRIWALAEEEDRG